MPIVFTKAKLQYGWMGNMSSFPLEYNGKTWRTAEALFQALRFEEGKLNVDNIDIREVIRAERSPMVAKWAAKTHTDCMTIVPTSAQDLANMELVLRLKLEQYPALREELKNTGDEIIIEDVTKRAKGRNSFWGMALKDGAWVGDNALGKIWMKLRSELK